MNTQKKKRSVSGSAALARMIRYSKDQVVGSLKRRYTGKKAMTNIASDMKTIMSIVNTEEKQIYTQAAAQTVAPTSPLVFGIGTTAQGTSGGQRVGDSIKINRIDLKLQFAFTTGAPGTTGAANQIFNWYMVRYLKTPSSSGTTAFGIAELLLADVNTNYTPMSFPNTDTNENFQVMGSGIIQLDLDLIGTVSLASICDNMVFLVFTSLVPSNAGGSSTVSIGSCINFVDN